MRRIILDFNNRFWSKVQVTGRDECWEWQACKNNTGYGTFHVAGKNRCAHRVAAYLSGLVDSLDAPKDRKGTGFLLHRCDNAGCCNPRHLRVGTYSENHKEAYERSRRAQPKGQHHANAKLTNRQAADIRRKYRAGGVSQDALAAKYGVSQRAVSLIIRGETYQCAG